MKGYFLAVLLLATGAVSAQTIGGSNPTKQDLDESARVAVLTLKQSGANGLIQAINECYQARVDQGQQDFKCVWLDFAGRHVDVEFSKAAHIPQKFFWSYEQMAARSSPSFKAAGMSSDQAETYYNAITPTIYASVDKYLTEATPIPSIDIKSYCRKATANIQPNDGVFEACVGQESETLKGLQTYWPSMPEKDREQCVSETKVDSQRYPNGLGYLALGGCVERVLNVTW